MADPKLIAQGEQRREEIYTFLASYIAAKGYAPSFREIGDAVGIKNATVIKDHLARLQQEGRVNVAPGVPRGISIVKGRRRKR